MEFQQLIEARRSVRRYDPSQRPTKEDILTIIKAAQEAPSWKNQQTSRYYCAVSAELCEKLRETIFPSFNKQRSENAALIVTAFEKNNVGFADDRQTPLNELGNGWGCYDLGLQAAYLILKAKELGYDTLIMGIRDAQAIRKELDIPEDQEIVSVIAVGKAAESPARPKRKELHDIAKVL
ncbi:MAG: nitroreductase family protein [Ruminococcus sp.]|nr:nitroreductase family protein [Ruminococcus sp.]